jgi:hypothetical protein
MSGSAPASADPLDNSSIWKPFGWILRPHTSSHRHSLDLLNFRSPTYAAQLLIGLV